MMKHIKGLCAVIGAILLFYVVKVPINILLKDGFHINVINNIEAKGSHAHYVGGIEIALLTILMDGLVFFIAYLIFLKRGNLIKVAKLNKGYDIKKLSFIIPAILGSVVIGGIVSSVAGHILGSNVLVPKIFNNMFKSPVGIIQTVIIAPIVEETIFRGLLFNYLRKRYPLIVALIIQAVAFGILHGNVEQGFFAGTIGLTLGIIYLYTDSLWGDITAHGIANGSGVLLTLISLSGINKIIGGFIMLVVIILYIVCIFIGFNKLNKKVLPDLKRRGLY